MNHTVAKISKVASDWQIRSLYCLKDTDEKNLFLIQLYTVCLLGGIVMAVLIMSQVCQ